MSDIDVKFGGDTRGLHDAVGRAKGEVHGFDKEIDIFSSRLKRVAELMVASFTIRSVVEWTQKMGDAAEAQSHYTQQTGLSALETAQWTAIAENEGKTMETIVGGLAKLTKAQIAAASGGKAQANAFREIGLSAKEAHSADDVLLAVADKFHSMEDGAHKTQIALALFGKSGQQLIPILNQGRDALEAAKKEAYELGSVFGKTTAEQDAFLAKGLALDNANDSLKLGMKGLSNVMFDALGPSLVTVINGMVGMIKQFVDSYRRGGEVRVMVNNLSQAFTTLVIAIAATGSALEIAGRALGGYGNAASTFMEGWGRLVRSNFTGAKDFALGQSLMAQAKKEADENTAAIGRAQGRYNAFLDKMLHPPKLPPLKAGGGSDDEITAFPAASKDTQVQDWEDQLKRMLMASKTYFADTKQVEYDFWKEKLALTAAGSKNELKVKEHMFELMKGMLHDELQEDLDVLKDKEDAAKGYYDRELALANDKITLMAQTYGEDTREWRDALREKEKLERDHLKELDRLEGDRLAHVATMAEAQVNITREHLQAQLNLSMISDMDRARSELALSIASENAIYSAKLESMRKTRDLDSTLPNERDSINHEIEELEQAHNGRMQAIQDAGLQKEVEIWQGRVEAFTGPLESMTTSLLTRQATFQQAAIRLGDELLGKFVGWCFDMVAHWAAMELAKTATSGDGALIRSVLAANEFIASQTLNAAGVVGHTTAEGAKTGATAAGTAMRLGMEVFATAKSIALSAWNAIVRVGHLAAVAAAGAYAAIASIPVIGPFLAPISAAIALGAVLAFAGKLFSAEGGFGDVPTDGTLTSLHKKEMVLPAKFAVPLRDMLTNPGIGATGLAGRGNGASAGKGGDANLGGFTYAPNITNPEPDLNRLLQTQASDMRRWLRDQLRDREFTTALREAMG